MITKLKTSPVRLPLVLTDNNEDDVDDRDDVQALGNEDELTLHLGLLAQGFTRFGSNCTRILHKGYIFKDINVGDKDDDIANDMCEKFE